MEMWIIIGGTFSEILGVVAGFILALVAFWFAWNMAVMGHSAIAISTVLTTIGGLAGVYGIAQYSTKSQREKKPVSPPHQA